MSDTTAPAQQCNCLAPSRAEGPWHPLGDTPLCPPPPETPADFCRWLLTLDDPEDVLGMEAGAEYEWRGAAYTKTRCGRGVRADEVMVEPYADRCKSCTKRAEAEIRP